MTENDAGDQFARVTIPTHQAKAGNSVQKIAIGCGIAIAVMVTLFIGLGIFGAVMEEREKAAERARTQSTPPELPKPLPPGDARPARPANGPGSWITTGDYPKLAIMQGHDGTTRFRLDIDSNGRVRGCTITQSSGHDDLDEVTCNAIIRRARFHPALDEKGNAVPSTYSNSVRWILPRD